MKLTAAEVRKLDLEHGAAEAIVFDDDIRGFGVRLRAGGSRTFIYQYKVGAKHRRLTLGSVQAVDFSAARDTAKDLYAKVRLGGDPAGEKRHARAKATETFDAIVKLYLDRQRLQLRPSSYVNLKHHLNVHAKALHRLQLEKITRRDIASCVMSVKTNSGIVISNRVRSSLSGFFAWTIGEGLLESNPVIGTNRSEEKSRARVLDFAELRLIWNALPDDHYGAILRLLMLTGQRAGEIAGLRWSEIQDNAFLLPSHRTKNKSEHLIPLSSAASDIIAAQTKRKTPDSKLRDLIFGYSSGPFSGWSGCKEALDARIAEKAEKPLPHWTVHDLRRSFATHAAGIGIQPHIVEAILNHISGHRAGVAGIYNRATYEPEKRTALDRWAEHLIAIVESRESNVTPIRRPA
jgi:integrase